MPNTHVPVDGEAMPNAPSWRGRPVSLNRKAIENEIEQLIELLDVADDDPDAEDNGDEEPSHGWTGEGRGTVALDRSGNHDDERELDESDWEDGADKEPSLGSPELRVGSIESPWGRSGVLTRDGLGTQENWARGCRNDREVECEDEGAQVEDGHSLGWQNEGSQERLDASHDEPDLGSTEEIDQSKRDEISRAMTWLVQDGETDLGFVGIATGYREGEGQDDREEQCEDEGAQCDDEGVVESGIADSDALHSLEGNGAAFGDRSGNKIAKRLLERAKRGPLGVIVREILAGPEFRQ